MRNVILLLLMLLLSEPVSAGLPGTNLMSVDDIERYPIVSLYLQDNVNHRDMIEEARFNLIRKLLKQYRFTQAIYELSDFRKEVSPSTGLFIDYWIGVTFTYIGNALRDGRMVATDKEELMYKYEVQVIHHSEREMKLIKKILNTKGKYYTKLEVDAIEKLSGGRINDIELEEDKPIEKKKEKPVKAEAEDEDSLEGSLEEGDMPEDNAVGELAEEASPSSGGLEEDSLDDALLEDGGLPGDDQGGETDDLLDDSIIDNEGAGDSQAGGEEASLDELLGGEEPGGESSGNSDDAIGDELLDGELGDDSTADSGASGSDELLDDGAADNEQSDTDLGGDEPGGDELGGDELGGDELGGDELGGDELGGDELGGDELGGSEVGGEMLEEDELGGDELSGMDLEEDGAKDQELEDKLAKKDYGEVLGSEDAPPVDDALLSREQAALKYYEKAIEYFNKLISMGVDNPYRESALIKKAEVFKEMGRDVLAVEQYNIFLQVFPHSDKVIDVLIAKGDLLAAQKRYRQAIGMFQEILEIFPETKRRSYVKLKIAYLREMLAEKVSDDRFKNAKTRELLHRIQVLEGFENEIKKKEDRLRELEQFME